MDRIDIHKQEPTGGISKAAGYATWGNLSTGKVEG